MPFIISFRKFKESCDRTSLFRMKILCSHSENKTIEKNANGFYGICSEKHCPILGGCVKVEKEVFETAFKIYRDLWKEIKK